MEVLLDVFFDLFGEFIVQVMFQLLGELGAHAIAAHREEGPRSPALSITAHVLFGAGLGGLTLLILPRSLLRGAAARLANLALSPLAAGALTALIGRVRRRRGRDTVRLERFVYGFLFAFSFALVRFLATG